MRKLFIWLIILAILLGGGVSALADEEVLVTIPGGQELLLPQPKDTRDPATEYIRQKLYPNRPTSRAKRAAGASLTGPALTLYTRLMEDISAVANGTKTSTAFSYTAADIYSKDEFTAEDLGLSSLVVFDEAANEWRISPEANAGIAAVRNSVEILTVLDCLLADSPFELYWYDKTRGVYFGYPKIESNGEKFFMIGNVTIQMIVAEEYAVQGDESASFEVDSKYGTGVNAAVTNAQTIVNRHRGKTDYARLAGYRDEICTLTGYNYDAAYGENVPYGNPWQLIWVFDGDPETTVVCEGYAKAFQYLNELSGDADVSVICVSGVMFDESGGGNHMWNIVNMDNGKNYMADITNCDIGETGSDELFLVGYADGSVAEGYTFIDSYGWTYEYIYQDNVYPDDALEIWDKSYLESQTEKPPVYSLSSDIGYAGYRCAIQLDAPYEAVYILETGETLVPDSEGWFVVSSQIIGDEDMTFTIAAVWDGKLSPYGETLTLTAGTPDGSLDFPDGLTVIEQEAFRGARVTAAVFPESILVIGEYAFADNPDLVLIELNGQQVGEGAFSNCPQAVYCVDEEEAGQYFAEGKKFLVKE